MELNTQTKLKDNEFEICFFKGKRNTNIYCLPSNMEAIKKLDKNKSDDFHKKVEELMDIVSDENKDEMDKGYIVKRIVTV